MGFKRRERPDGPALREIMQLATHAGLPKLRLHLSARDKLAMGTAFPSDVEELLNLAKKGQLRELGDFTTLAFWWGERFFASGRNPVPQVLRDSFDEDVFFPLYLLCHLSGCIPLAYTGTSFYGWLLHIEGSRKGRTPVYEFSLHDAKTYPKFETLTELVRDAATRSGLIEGKATEWKPAYLRPIDDPSYLWRRSLWLADALSNDLDKLAVSMKRAIGTTDFESELPLLEERPSLAFFWLTTHALFANDRRFDLAVDATINSKSLLVMSLRKALLVWRNSDEKAGIAGLDKAATARIVAAVRDNAPRMLRKELAG